jgi:hypothetical protein
VTGHEVMLTRMSCSRACCSSHVGCTHACSDVNECQVCVVVDQVLQLNLDLAEQTNVLQARAKQRLTESENVRARTPPERVVKSISVVNAHMFFSRPGDVGALAHKHRRIMCSVRLLAVCAVTCSAWPRVEDGEWGELRSTACRRHDIEM